MRDIDSSQYPWENRYLTSDEQEVIAFFETQSLSDLIYANVPRIANRISGVGFLPVLSERVSIGTALYYGLITLDQVHERTVFSLSGFTGLQFYRFKDTDPTRSLKNSIIGLNMSLEEDLHALKAGSV